jgi:hypothetical protein
MVRVIFCDIGIMQKTFAFFELTPTPVLLENARYATQDANSQKEEKETCQARRQETTAPSAKPSSPSHSSS